MANSLLAVGARVDRGVRTDPTQPDDDMPAHWLWTQTTDGAVKTYLAGHLREYAAQKVAHMHAAYCHSQQQFVDAAAEIERLRAIVACARHCATTGQGSCVEVEDASYTHHEPCNAHNCKFMGPNPSGKGRR